MQRIFITVKDLQILTNTTERNCRRKMQLMKDAFKKSRHQQITFREYSNYMNVSLDEIYEALGMKKPEKTTITGNI